MITGGVYPWLPDTQAPAHHTCCMCDGDGSIAHRVQLVEATRLKATWHEQDVSSCSQAVAEPHVEPNPASCLGAVCGLQPAQAILGVGEGKLWVWFNSVVWWCTLAGVVRFSGWIQ